MIGDAGDRGLDGRIRKCGGLTEILKIGVLAGI
jgi:hypothetical protein